MDTRYYERERPEVLAFVPDGVRRVLDVGAAPGAFGQALKQHCGCEVWGIEAHAPAAAEAARVLDRVLASPVEAALEALPDGGFLCSIPNVRYYKHLRGLLLRAEWEYVDSGILDNSHLRFYTHKSIRRMFGRLGCDVLRLQGIHGRDRMGLTVLNAQLLGAAWDLRYKQIICLARPAGSARA